MIDIVRKYQYTTLHKIRLEVVDFILVLIKYKIDD